MKRIQKIVILSALIILAISGILISRKKTSGPEEQKQETVQTFKSILKINDKSFNIDEYVGKTALISTNAIVKIETKGEGEMAFVTSINGHTADPNKKQFWEFLVNGKQAEIGAGSYIVRPGDQIEWKLSTY